ncbi:ribulose-phosphate 3-epimerase [Campylobacter aviculae]|uniref:Ribulose-phosphate 3-epimerase n=1 Tax=Campylobacter aviculae TaxID=2510190 RepID=A0A4U7BSV7_9BACT|nr:hypothetical protein [Campylobacter aviculae]TKX32196.1 hypothetical protein CQA76_04715 [Campylobacter aviculae]
MIDKKFSASMVCSSFVDLKETIEILNSNVHLFHIDMMDNHFVYNLGLSYDQINEIRTFSRLPFDFHIMMNDPCKVIERDIIKSGDMVSIHMDSVFNFTEIAEKIKGIGAKVLLAINPLSPTKSIELVYDLIDGVNYLTVNPGYASQTQLSIAQEQAKNIGILLSKYENKDFIFEVDGNMSLKNIEIFSKFGANHFVLGTSSIFPNHCLDKERLAQLTNL